MKNDKPKNESKLKRAVAQKRGKVLDELRNVKNKATEKIKKSKREHQDKKSAKSKNTVSINRLELMITVVNRNKAEFFADLIQSFSVNMQLLAGAQGTAITIQPLYSALCKRASARRFWARSRKNSERSKAARALRSWCLLRA